MWENVNILSGKDIVTIVKQVVNLFVSLFNYLQEHLEIQIVVFRKPFDHLLELEDVTFVGFAHRLHC